MLTRSAFQHRFGSRALFVFFGATGNAADLNASFERAGFTSGTAVSMTASPNGTYTFLNWTATNCTLANANTASTTCTMTGAGNASVTAKFRKH